MLLSFDGASGLLNFGCQQTINPDYFVAPNGLTHYFGFDTDCLDFANDIALNLARNDPLPGGTTTVTSNASASNSAGFTIFNRYYPLQNGTIVTKLGFYLASAATLVAKIGYTTNNTTFTVVVSQSFSHGGTGWEDVTLTTPYVIPPSGTFYIGVYNAAAYASCTDAVNRSYLSGDVTGTSAGFGAVAGPVIGTRYTSSDSVNIKNGFLNALTAASVRSGRIGQALSFNGTTTYIDIRNGNPLSTDTQSIAFWLVDKGTDATRYIIGRGVGSGDNDPCVGLLYLGGNLELRVKSANNTRTLCTYASLTNGDHIVVVLDYPTWTFYKNAQRLNNGTVTDHFNFNYPLAIATSIGRQGSFNGYYFDGILDDFRIYNRAIDQSEIIELYKAGLTGQRNALNNASLLLPIMREPILSLYQRHYRFRTDGDAVDATPTWGADEDAA